jgi:hypothetical protein
MPFDTVFDYSYDAIMRSFEDSLQRPGLAQIDIRFVHDIGAMQHGPDAHPGIMRTLRESGYRALEELRGRRAYPGGWDRRQTRGKYSWRRWSGVLGTFFFSPADTLSLSRRLWMIYFRSASLWAHQSWLAAR